MLLFINYDKYQFEVVLSLTHRQIRAFYSSMIVFG